MKPSAEWLKSIGAKAVTRRTDLDDVSADKYAISYTSREDAKGRFIGMTSSTAEQMPEEVPVKEKKEKAPREEKKQPTKEERSEKKSHRSESSRSETRHRDSDSKKEKREGKH